VRLAVVLAREQGEVERVARQAAARHPARLGHVHDLGEHVLHRQRGADLDAHARLDVARIGEAVHDAGRFSKLLLDFRKDARRYLPDGLFYCL